MTEPESPATPGSSAETAFSSRLQRSKLRLLGRLIVKQSWLSGVILLCLTAAVAKLMGMTDWDVLTLLIVGLVLVTVVVAGYHAYYYTPKETEEEKRARVRKERRESFTVLFYTGMGFVIAKYQQRKLDNAEIQKQQEQLNAEQGFTGLPGQPQSSALIITRKFSRALANRTEGYWIATVSAMHQLRFGLPPQPGEMSQAYELRRNRFFKIELAQAQATPTTEIDAQLVAMVQQLFKSDATELQLYDRIVSLHKLRGIKSDPIPAEESLQRWLQVFGELNDEDVNMMSPEQQEQLAEFVKLQATRLEQFREVELMQVRMQERYKGWKFPLPEVFEGT